MNAIRSWLNMGCFKIIIIKLEEVPIRELPLVLSLSYLNLAIIFDLNQHILLHF